MINCNILLFDNFETLDAFGPAEIIGYLKEDYRLEYYSMHGGIVTSSQNIRIDTLKAQNMQGEYILLVPGGYGTRALINDSEFLDMLKAVSVKAAWLLSVCTGSALLAKAGVLNGRKATSNKRAFDWVVGSNPEVNWVKKARWVVDGNLYTSSGVSAGMDMALGFIADRLGSEKALETAASIEYIWNSNKDEDPFA